MDKTFEEVKNIYEGNTVTQEEIENIFENPNCYSECNGDSGKYIGKKWYTVYEVDENGTKTGEEFQIYF